MQNHAPCLLLLFEKEKNKSLCKLSNFERAPNFLTEGTLYSQTFATSDCISHQVPIKVKLHAANESHNGLIVGEQNYTVENYNTCCIHSWIHMWLVIRNCM